MGQTNCKLSENTILNPKPLSNKTKFKVNKPFCSVSAHKMMAPRIPVCFKEKTHTHSLSHNLDWDEITPSTHIHT